MSISTHWTKSSHSDAGGSCVEVRRAPDGKIQVRDSKDPSGPVLAFTRDEWIAFIGGTKRGGYNL
jgi:hypothetical protein